MKNLIIPDGYQPAIDIRETEIAIKDVKDFFERELAKELNLTRVSAPLFVKPETGLNDNLNGVERPVSFGIKEQNDANVEIVHSLAKWKRLALQRYNFSVEEGLYTDMNAIRRDEDTDNIHSIFVDQWDWEKIISKEDRTMETLQSVVKNVYNSFKATETFICNKYTYVTPTLPEEIAFVTTQELEDMYPNCTAKEREYNIAKLKGAVFIMQIGGALNSGERHDGRAPDYDDWTLNGDIIFYYSVLDIALELSSMGIRVDEDALRKQLEISGCTERAELPFQKALLNGELPYTIGGGIGQSRICMFFLRKAHIGEVQASIWPEDIMECAAKNNIALL
ncbi:aspartate--ammonia ligase [Anaerosporobacter sp.]|uniref:aspartate--ammonia ligase n=1 Tax=Anaerosporobacter sp. TaxID=1872529 RepID=UPI00286FA222|nr:aspartate--ammonia ligase [Anaerosporobacter sp.]